MNRPSPPGLRREDQYGREGKVQDNIFVEWLWGTVEYEGVYLKAHASVLKAQRGLEDYFRFYNGLRPHQTLATALPPRSSTVGRKP